MKNSLLGNWSFLKKEVPFPFGAKAFHSVQWWLACQEGTVYVDLEELKWVESEQSLVHSREPPFQHMCGTRERVASLSYLLSRMKGNTDFPA